MPETFTPTEDEKLAHFQAITAFPEEEYDKVVKLLKDNSWNLELALSKYFDGDFSSDARPRAPTPPPAREVPQPEPLQRLAMNELEMMNMMNISHLPPQLPIVKPLANKWKNTPGLIAASNSNFSSFLWSHFGLGSAIQSPIIFILMLIPRTVTFLLSGLGYLFELLFPPSPDLVPWSPTIEKFEFNKFYQDLTHEQPLIVPFEGEFNQCFERAKKECRFMLLMLLSDNGSSTTFVKTILNNSSVADSIREHDVLPFIANVNEPQGFEIAKNFRTKAVPAVYLLANVTSGPSGISSMSLISRIPTKSVNSFKARLRLEVEKYKPELISKKFEQDELDYSRKIKELQDKAYEESLLADKLKQAKKEEEERLRKSKEDAIKWNATQKKKFFSSILNKFEKLNELDKKESTNIRFKLPHGEMLTQKFSLTNTLFDIYSFIDLHLYLKELSEEERKEMELIEENEVDDKYKHKFGFELISPFPRYTLPINDSLAKDDKQIWPNGSLLLEFEEEDEEEAEEED